MKDDMYSCDLDPCTKSKLNLVLYENVTNLDELKEKIISGSLKCCIIKSSLICDPFQVVVAANKASVSYKRNAMTTRSIYSEILFNLSLSKNISQSLTTFGIDKNESNYFVAIINEDGVDSTEEVLKEVNGLRCSLNALDKFQDLKQIKKIYKLPDFNATQLLDIIISKLVTKDFISS